MLAIIDGVIADIRAGKFSDEELALAKKMVMCYDARGKQENEAVAQNNALSELFGQGYDYSKKYYAKIREVSREDIVRVANKIFSRPALRVFVRPVGMKGVEDASGRK